MSKKDEQLINKGDDIEEEDRYSVAVVDNPIYDVDPDERTGTVAYYKSGHDDDDDDIEEVVKVCAYSHLVHAFEFTSQLPWLHSCLLLCIV